MRIRRFLMLVIFIISVVDSTLVYAEKTENKWHTFEQFEAVYKRGGFNANEIKNLYLEYQIYQKDFIILDMKLKVKETYYSAKQLPESLVKRLVEAYRQANYPLLVQNGVQEQAMFFIDICTKDCSGHFAGYEWAAINDAQYVYECHGPSPSFSKGCELYLNGY